MFDNRRALKFNEFLVKSCQLPVASCQLPVASCQLPVKMENKLIKILEI
jgi:hypothetical protein